MGNNHEKENTEFLSPLGLFVVGLRKFRGKIPALTVDSSFEVINGLVGMMRNVMLRLCAVISSRWGMTKRKNKSLRVVVGISQEQMALRKHRFFVEIRTFTLMPVHPMEDLYHARAFVTKYHHFAFQMADRPNSLDAVSIAEDVLCMAEMLATYHRVSDTNSTDANATNATEVPSVLLDCLLEVSRVFANSYTGDKEKAKVKVQQAMGRSPAFCLLRNFTRMTRSAFHRRMGFAVLGTFCVNRWVLPGCAMRNTEIMGMVDVIRLYDTMFRSCPAFSDPAAIKPSEVSHGLASPFGNISDENMLLLRRVVRIVTSLDPKLCEQYNAHIFAALAGLLGSPNAIASFVALHALLSFKDGGSVKKLIDGGVVEAMEQRLGVHVPGVTDMALLNQLCRPPYDDNDPGTEAVYASGVIPILLQFLRKIMDHWLDESAQSKTVKFLVATTGQLGTATSLRRAEMLRGFGAREIVREVLGRTKRDKDSFSDLEYLHYFLSPNL